MHSNQHTSTKVVNHICSTEPLKPALASIPDACKYMGNLSRAKFYSDVLPLLEAVHIGSRHFVVVASMDRLINSLKEASAENHDTPMTTEPGQGAS
jgi:hypothetical protein